MKKACVLSIIGIAASTAQSHGVGYVVFSNYETPPYNQVLYGNGNAVRDPVQIQIWYGQGVITDGNALTAVATTVIDTGFNTYDPHLGHGPGGYFDPVMLILPTWNPGDTFTFQLRATGYEGRTILWTESASISPGPDPVMPTATLPQLVLTPEPSVFTLIGLGTGGFWFFRRRR
jgi:hypothetical protein